MDRAAILARIGAPERTAVVCDRQTAGRGRDGRVWQAPPGDCLYTTLILRPPVSPDRLSPLALIAGVAAAEAIEHAAGARVHLKWPNDLWLGNDPDRQKVGGILTTSHLLGASVAYVLVGIGINIDASYEDLPAGATSIREATGMAIAPTALLSELLARVDAGYAEFVASAGQPSLDSWRTRAALLAEDVAVEVDGQRVVGRFAGIDDDGALLLDQGDGAVRRVLAGDLARGPRRATP